MKLTIASVGKVRKGPFKTLADDYHARLQHYRPLDLVDVRESSASDAEQRKLEEGAALLAAVPDGATIVALDERGKHWTSVELARWLDEKMVEGTRHVALLVGGPEGLSVDVRKRAHVVLALSKFTFPHDLARVVLAEQLYRAFTIVRGEPYHR